MAKTPQKCLFLIKKIAYKKKEDFFSTYWSNKVCFPIEEREKNKQAQYNITQHKKHKTTREEKVMLWK